MANIGEQIVSSYLRYIEGCDFIQTNLYIVDTQGEIDVVGICLKEQKVYICESAIHLTTGLLYTKDSKTNNIEKLTEKFSRDIEYAEKYLSEYKRIYMLWSPVVKGGGRRSPENDQLLHLEKVQANIKAKYGVEIELVINESFKKRLNQMRTYAKSVTSELKCPVMRMYQVEAYLNEHIQKSPSTSVPQ